MGGHQYFHNSNHSEHHKYVALCEANVGEYDRQRTLNCGCFNHHCTQESDRVWVTYTNTTITHHMCIANYVFTVI